MQGPRKKVSYQDPLIGHGRHFGCTIHALCRIHTVINNGLIIEAELIDGSKRFEYKVYRQILTLTPTMEDRINSASEEELLHISDLLQKDRLTDSDRFYNTVLAVLNDPDELIETNQLLQWWNRQVFPGHEEQACQSANPKTALAHINARQAALMLVGQASSSN
ncbi:hypothetical protein DXG01_014941 [Tephrocybe rancida]|nr:hypothetical protein DXG01_014941 [Tephrocybe rancida]